MREGEEERQFEKEGLRRSQENASETVCNLQNDTRARCHYQQCRYEHLCSHCLGEHRKANCKLRGGERLREAGPPGR